MNGASQAATIAPPGSINKPAKPQLLDKNGNAIPPTHHHGEEKCYLGGSGFDGSQGDTFADLIQGKIHRVEQELYELRLVKDKAKELKFKVGDAAKHPKYGNVLITDIYCKPIHSISMNIPWPDNRPDVVFQYGIVHTGGPQKNNYGRADQAVVPPDELMPITEMAETLFR